jgi:hypothetical protein
VGKVWQVTTCDAVCSYGVATLMLRVTQVTGTQFRRAHLVSSYQRTGPQARAVLTDGGPEFYRRFSVPCRTLNIQHRRTRPRPAWPNGFVAWSQGTILAEL